LAILVYDRPGVRCALFEAPPKEEPFMKTAPLGFALLLATPAFLQEKPPMVEEPPREVTP
jgi:hypothetical protein